MTKKQLARYHAERIEKIRREVLVHAAQGKAPDSIEAKMLAEHERRVERGIFLNYRD